MNFCRFLRLWTAHHYVQKAHGITASIFVFSRNGLKLSRFQEYSKSKNASKLCLKNYLISLFLFCFSYYLSFDFQFAKIQLISGLAKKKERSPLWCSAWEGEKMFDVRGMRADVSPRRGLKRWGTSVYRGLTPTAKICRPPKGGFIESAKNNFLKDRKRSQIATLFRVFLNLSNSRGYFTFPSKSFVFISNRLKANHFLPRSFNEAPI